LKQNGLISSKDKVKVLGRGELTSKIDVTVHAISASARKAIEDKGGVVTLLESKNNEENK
jgi:large subunit ribosomal protein L15